MKKKILTFGTIIILLGMILTQCISATVTEGKTIASVKMSILEGDFTNEENENSEESVCLGSIYGHTGILYIWGFSPVRFAKVQAGGKTTISGPIMGEYRIRGLPLGTYTVTGSKPGYITYTTTVTLTEKHPDKQVFIDLQPNDNSLNKARIQNDVSNEENNGFGSIYGKTWGSFEHAAWILPFVKIQTEGKTVYSGIGSRYILSSLELGYTYEIIASKPGYYTSTYHVELTSEEPYKYQNIYLMPNGDYVPVEKTEKQVLTKSKESACTGYILDRVGNSHGIYAWESYPFAKVDAGIKQTQCGPLGFFRMFLSLNQEFEITAYHGGFKPLTREVELTTEIPHKEITFDLFESKPVDNYISDITPKTTEKTTGKNTTNNNGKISGDVVTPGFSLFVGVPGIKMACGKNYNEYVTTVTDDCGEFEFTDLPYEDSGTVYRVFMLKTPGIIHVLQKKRVTLDSENPEVKIRFILPFVFFNREVENRPRTLRR